MAGDDDLRALLARYNPPPPFPAEHLRAAIRSAREPDSSRWRHRSQGLRWMLPTIRRVAAGLALFLVGTGAGYFVARTEQPDPAPVARLQAGSDAAAHSVVWF